MLRPRIIPCLLIHRKGLTKTVNFGNHKYIGDPINAVRIFNEKEVDEIIILDIDATVNNTEPDFALIKNLASECRMPLCIGGGIKTVEHAKKIINLGVEKVALSSAAVENPNLIYQISKAIGTQSTVVAIDIKKTGLFNNYGIFTHNGTVKKQVNPLEFILEIEKLGAGELLINSIDNDGVMKGFDINLIEKIRQEVSLPITILGGAGNYEDLKAMVDKYKIIGVAAGSIFVFKGKYKAVLINYPNFEEKKYLFSQAIPSEFSL